MYGVKYFIAACNMSFEGNGIAVFPTSETAAACSPGFNISYTTAWVPWSPAGHDSCHPPLSAQPLCGWPSHRGRMPTHSPGVMQVCG